MVKITKQPTKSVWYLKIILIVYGILRPISLETSVLVIARFNFLLIDADYSSEKMEYIFNL